MSKKGKGFTQGSRNIVTCPECGGQFYSKGMGSHRGRRLCRIVARRRKNESAAAKSGQALGGGA